MNPRLPALLLCLALSPAWAIAATFSYPNTTAPLFEVDLPDRWVVEIKEEALHTSPPDESLYLGFVTLDASLDGDAVGEAIDQLVTDVVNNPSVDGEKEIVVNGIALSYFQGSGTDRDSGGPLKYAVGMFSPNGEIVCVIFYFAPPEGEARHQQALSGIVNSIRHGGTQPASHPAAPAPRAPSWQPVAIGSGWGVDLPPTAERVAPGPNHKFVVRDPATLIGLSHEQTAGACAAYLENTRKQTLKALENPAQQQLMQLMVMPIEVTGRAALVTDGGTRTPDDVKLGIAMRPISILSVCVTERDLVTVTISMREGALSNSQRDMLRRIAGSARPM